MLIDNNKQGSVEWFKARCGVPSASNFNKIVTAKGKPSKQRARYMYQLAGEKLKGMPEENYQNAAMLRGIELEHEARQAYEIINGCKVDETGFCMNEQPLYGASCDALVGSDGLVEIKCPSIAVHVEYLLGNKVPADYVQQVQGQLLVTNRQWCDFVSYHPDLPILVVRAKRDSEFLSLLSNELELFCAELEHIITKISRKEKL